MFHMANTDKGKTSIANLVIHWKTSFQEIIWNKGKSLKGNWPYSHCVRSNVSETCSGNKTLQMEMKKLW